MSEYLVTCINKPNRDSQHEHITHIGNISDNWRMTREEAIRRIDSKEQAFYTLPAGSNKKVYIGVVREQGKAPYLRTYADGYYNNNLLSLPECSTYCKLVT